MTGYVGEAIRLVRDSGANVSSTTTNYLKSVPVGHTVLLAIMVTPPSACTGMTATDAAGNTYTERQFIVHSGSSSNGNLSLLGCKLTNAVTTATVLTLGNVSSLRSPATWLSLGQEFDNLSLGFDTSASATGTSNTPAAGPTATAAQDSELEFAALGYTSNPTFAMSGFTLPAGGGAIASTALRNLQVGWKFVNVSGTRSASASLGSGQAWTAAVGAWKVDANPEAFFKNGSGTWVPCQPIRL